MNEKELIRKAMSALGKRTSPAKKRAARANAKLPRKGHLKTRRGRVLTTEEAQKMATFSHEVRLARKAGSAPRRPRRKTTK